MSPPGFEDPMVGGQSPIAGPRLQLSSYLARFSPRRARSRTRKTIMDLKPDFTFRPLPPVAQPDHFPFEDIPSPLGPLLLSSRNLDRNRVQHDLAPIFRRARSPSFSGAEPHRTKPRNSRRSAVLFPIAGFSRRSDHVRATLSAAIRQRECRGNPGVHTSRASRWRCPGRPIPKSRQRWIQMSSIPHGTTILAQGTGTGFSGPPTIPPMNIVPICNTTVRRQLRGDGYLPEERFPDSA